MPRLRGGVRQGASLADAAPTKVRRANRNRREASQAHARRASAPSRATRRVRQLPRRSGRRAVPGDRARSDRVRTTARYKPQGLTPTRTRRPRRISVNGAALPPTRSAVRTACSWRRRSSSWRRRIASPRARVEGLIGGTPQHRRHCCSSRVGGEGGSLAGTTLHASEPLAKAQKCSEGTIRRWKAGVGCPQGSRS